MKRAALAVLLVLVGGTLAAPWLAPHDPARQYREFANAPPGGDFLLGTDGYGRDLWSRLLHAGRWSMLAAGLAVALSLGWGTLLGLAASLSPRLIESSILWLADLTLSLPWLYLLFALRAMLPLSLAPEPALLVVISLVGCAGWATPAYLTRATAQSVLTMDYVRASRAFGASRTHILLRHVLPALGPVLSAQWFVLLPRYVLAESALSLLGLGMSEPTPTWGTMLGAARQSLGTGWQWWTLTPAMPLVLLMLASHLLAESAQRKS